MEQLFARRPLKTVQDIREATVEAGRRRIRPCLMTAFTTFAATSRDDGDGSRRRRRSRDGVAGVLRHVRGAGIALHRAGALLRLYGVQVADGLGRSLLGDVST